MTRTPEIRSLQAFVIVAQEGSVSRAAEILNLTQPAVSLQLKRLSEDTGLTLFHRASKGLGLTTEGVVMLAKANRVLSSLTEFNLTAKRMTGRVQGKLRIGTIVDPSFIRLGQLLAGLIDAYPEVQTSLTHGISGEVLTGLRRGKVDVGFFLGAIEDYAQTHVNHPNESLDDFYTRKLTEFNYRVIGPAGWEYQIKHAQWDELAAMPWIGTPENSVHSRLLDTIFHERGCTQNVVARVDQESSMMAMVQSGIGLSLCRESIALHEQQSGAISIANSVSIPTALCAVTLKAHQKDPVVDAFFNVLEMVW